MEETLGKRIAAWRRRVGMTQDQVDNRPFYISIFLHKAQYFPYLRTFPSRNPMHLHILS